MRTTDLADVRMQLSRYLEDVVRTHERVTITKDGRPVAVLLSVEDLEALEETSYWAGQERPPEDGEPVDASIVLADLRSSQGR